MLIFVDIVRGEVGNESMGGELLVVFIVMVFGVFGWYWLLF